MKYAVLLTLLGLAQIALSASAFAIAVWLGVLVFWSGISWCLAGGAYVGLGKRVFGKHISGTMNPVNRFVMLPYLLVTWGLWHAQRVLSKEPPHHEIAPNLFLGRRCSVQKLPESTGLIVDLCAEFVEAKAVRTHADYLCVPTLDAALPSAELFAQMVQTIAGASREKPVYIHCAKGHGRSAAVMIAALVATRTAASLDEAEQIVRGARRGVRINTSQRRGLEAWFSASNGGQAADVI